MTYLLDALNRIVGQLYLGGTRVTNTFDVGECAPGSGEGVHPRRGRRRGPASGQQLTQQHWLGIRSFGYELNGRQTSVAYPTGLNLTMGFELGPQPHNAARTRQRPDDTGLRSAKPDQLDCQSRQ